MAIFNDTIPAEDEAVKQGASRIRDMKTSLNSALSQIFNDSLTFLSNWVTSTILQSHASDDAQRAVDTNHIKTGAVTLPKFPDGVLTADAAGRAKMADEYITSAKLDPAIKVPDGSVEAQQIADDAVGTNELVNLAVTIAKVGSGIAKIAIGTYAGSNTVSASISGLAFAPDFVLLTAGSTTHEIAIAFRNASSGGIGPVIHAWDLVSGSTPSSTAIQWTSNGFIIVPANYFFNKSGRTHSYIALKV